MNQTKTNEGAPLVCARIAGLFGVLMLASGTFAGFVSSKLIVRNDMETTATNIITSGSLFRIGVVSSLIMMIAFMLYALFLYKLLRPVNRSYAMVMLGFVLASVPMYLLNQVNQFATLPLAQDRLYDQMKLFLELHRVGNLMAGIFFGLWLFPLGVLVFKSGFFPRILGVLLMLGSPGYLVLFGQAFLFPASEVTLWSNPLIVMTHLSELALLLWLLIRGPNVDQWKKRALESR